MKAMRIEEVKIKEIWGGNQEGKEMIRIGIRMETRRKERKS